MKPYELRRAIRNCASYHGHASAKEWGKLLDFAATQVVLDQGICERATLMTPSYARHGIPFYLAETKQWNVVGLQEIPKLAEMRTIEFYPQEYKIGNGRIRIRFSVAFVQNILVIWPKHDVSCTGRKQ